MPRFFTSAVQFDEAASVGSAVIDGEDGRHIARSLRMHTGDALTLSDGAGTDYTGEIESITGDTVMVPAEDSWCLTANTLAILIAVRRHTLALPVMPTHGSEHFHGYNRETRYPGREAISFTRWKLTQTLTLEHSDGDRILVSLYGDIALQHAEGVTMLPVGTASVIRAGQITLVPNGLSYVLVIN